MNPAKLRIVLICFIALIFISAGSVIFRKTCDIQVENSCIKLETVATPAAQAIGLSKYDNLQQDGGMLFVYDNPRQICIWMKDMKFSIDIIWLDAEKRIQHIESNVSPDTYPQSFCQEDSQYVVELPAGRVESLQLRTNQQLLQ